MIQAKDIIELVKIQLANWNISRNDTALYYYLNLGLIDLYEKFNIGIKSETVTLVPEQAVYNLKNNDVNLILKIYAENGQELKNSDVVDSRDWDYKLVNYNTFLVHNLKKTDGLLYVLYKAAPIDISDTNDVIDLPSAFREALMLYIMYLGTATIHSEASNEYRSWDTKSVFFTLYQQKCQELNQYGYRIPIDSEAMPIVAKGYV